MNIVVFVFSFDKLTSVMPNADKRNANINILHFRIDFFYNWCDKSKF
jgi:hypothetical protein